MKVSVACTYQGNYKVLAQAMNKYFQFNNNIMLLKTVVLLSYQRIKSF